MHSSRMLTSSLLHSDIPSCTLSSVGAEPTADGVGGGGGVGVVFQHFHS